MNCDEREPFEPLGEQSRRAMVHDGLGEMYLEPGSIITHEMISDWLGEPFPIPRVVRGGEFVVPHYGPMDEVKVDLLRQRGLLLMPVPNIGWRVASDAEMVEEAEGAWRKAVELLGRSSLIARHVRSSRVTPADAERVKAIQRDVLEEKRVLNAKARQRAEAASKW